MPLPLRLLSKEKVEATLHATDAACNIVTGRNYIFNKFGRFSDRAKLAYSSTTAIRTLGNRDTTEIGSWIFRDTVSRIERKKSKKKVKNVETNVLQGLLTHFLMVRKAPRGVRSRYGTF